MAELQLSDEREEQVRLLFKKPAENPKILIVTDKLLTGYDAPLLYCLYLDKPMRDHVLLQAIARVNRPYVDAKGVQKRVGLVVDFVGVLRELKKALQFDSSDVSGVIEDLDVLLQDFLARSTRPSRTTSRRSEGGSADERLERLVYGRFLAPEARKAFFEAYKEIEALWEILSPSPELRDHIDTYKRLSQLYAAVRNAYAEKVGFVGDLAYKTRRLIEESAEQQGLGRLTKTVTFDVKTLEALRGDDGLRRRQGLQPRARSAEGDRRRPRRRARAAAAEGTRRAHPQGPGGAQDDGPCRDGPAGGAGRREGRGDEGRPATAACRRARSRSTGCCVTTPP